MTVRNSTQEQRTDYRCDLLVGAVAVAFVLMFVLLSAVSQQLCDTYADESLDCCGHDVQPLSAHVIGAFSVAMLTASKSDEYNASSPQHDAAARVAHETYLVRDLWRVAPKTSPPSRHT